VIARLDISGLGALHQDRSGTTTIGRSGGITERVRQGVGTRHAQESRPISMAR